jgi:polyhydroxyalkanoate synthesis repressor PhaR
MPIIKRYSNRKLYDTSNKQYVSLDDIAIMVRSGEEVKIVDHASGDDITTLTLFQILFEEEKRIGGLMPQVFLTRLIRSGSEAVKSFRNTIFKPLQTTVAHTEIDAEIERRLLNLVNTGDLTSEEGARLQNLLVVPYIEPEVYPEPEIQEPEGIHSVPDTLITQLLDQLDRLEAELEEMRRK